MLTLRTLVITSICISFTLNTSAMLLAPIKRFMPAAHVALCNQYTYARWNSHDQQGVDDLDAKMEKYAQGLQQCNFSIPEYIKQLTKQQTNDTTELKRIITHTKSIFGGLNVHLQEIRKITQTRNGMEIEIPLLKELLQLSRSNKLMENNDIEAKIERYEKDIKECNVLIFAHSHFIIKRYVERLVNPLMRELEKTDNPGIEEFKLRLSNNPFKVLMDEHEFLIGQTIESIKSHEPKDLLPLLQKVDQKENDQNSVKS